MYFTLDNTGSSNEEQRSPRAQALPNGPFIKHAKVLPAPGGNVNVASQITIPCGITPFFGTMTIPSRM